uniref:Uncharacterized protein n=1 Tax=Lepeophtheirus salmonis TaxID=72036 RepID=A0A0K2SYQ6_LEPSM
MDQGHWVNCENFLEQKIMTPPACNPHQTVIFWDVMAPHESRVGFSGPIAHILLVNKAIELKMCITAEDDFTLKIRIIFEFSFSPFYESL